MSDVEIEWPWQYSFPPFFTLQPHPETRSKQVSAWKSLILEYCQKSKLYIIDVREANQLPLFNNSAINRKLDSSVVVSILSELSKTGNAAPLDKPKHRWEIYWHTLEEWASIIYDYVCENGMQNSVLTLFELSQGDDVAGRAFAGIHTDVLIKALQVLENQRKCELILSDEDQERDFYSRPDYVRKNLRHSKDARLKVWQATSIKSAAMEVNFFDRVLCLYRENRWKDLLDLRVESVAEARKLLWVWPSESNLKLIKSVVQGFGLKGVISIGCGCGLFEWLLQQYSGLPVIGYEVNEEWWSSRYSNPQFIKLNFPKLPPTPDMLTPDYALLFCYFNDGKAFREYIACYEGDLVFIIGPGVGSGRHTDPEPFTPDFGSSQWVLYKTEEVRDTQDFAGVYVRSTKDQSNSD